MRSTRFSLQLVVAGLALGAWAAVGGCSLSATSAGSESAAASPPLEDQGTSSSGSIPKPVADAAGIKASPYQGNPLCHVASSTCMPDDDLAQRSTGNVECVTPAPPPTDGGPAGTDLLSKGCRIGREGDVVAPRCLLAASAGGDGATCQIGEDCAPGFDCVAGDKGTKTCRHYCCSGSCKGNQSNGSATFCDVQSLVDVNQKAPVCMPLKRCSKLLGTNECSANETCTVVTEAGDTGCVVVGDKQVGESCDEAHCAAKLTCLGQPGARKCFKLCKVNASECPSTQSCVTNAAFKDADFGVCQ
ncbi:hypothetical protein BH11MYX4_BH11MYX4_68800 [soil metagenome]